MMNFLAKYRVVLVRGGQIIAFTGAILGTTKLALGIGAITGASTTAFLFLIIVLLSAFFGDLCVAITSSVVATLCFDYFFLPPFGTFYIASFSDWISLAAFLLASVIISRLTASAAENAAKAESLDKSFAQVNEFGIWLLSPPPGQHTLSGIAQAALRIFSLDYCSIHVYGDGKWQHFMGAAASGISEDVKNRLTSLKDHPTNLTELVNDHALGVRFKYINQGTEPMALLALRGEKLSAGVIGTMAGMIGIRLMEIVQNIPSQSQNR